MAEKLPTWDETSPTQAIPTQADGVLPTWDETTMASEVPEQSFMESTGEIASGLRHGFEQGISFGFADELKALGTSISPLQLLPGFESLTYEEALKVERLRGKEIEEKAPIASTIGDVAGSLILPGGATRGVASGLKTGAALGSVSGAGRTEESLLSAEGLKDVAIGAGLGGGLGGALPAVGALVKKTPSVVRKVVSDPHTRRLDALKKTTQEAEDITAGGTKLSEAVTAGEELGVFKDTAFKDLVPKVQATLKKKGESIKAEAKMLSEFMHPSVRRVTKRGMDKKIGVAKAKVINLTKDKVKNNTYTNKEGASIKKTQDEIFSKLEAAVSDSSPLIAIRTAKTGLSSKLKSKDFLPGGTATASKIETNRDMYRVLRELEQDAVEQAEEVFKKIYNKPGAEGVAARYKKSLDDYSALIRLENKLIQTTTKDKGVAETVFGGSDLMPLLAGSVGGVPTAIAAKGRDVAKRVLATSKAQFWISNLQDKPTPAKVKKVAKILGVKVEELTEYLTARSGALSGSVFDGDK